MGQALYRKYRSKKLSEIVGQSAVTTALENALKSGNISHAYLFTGPRGVGKTSIARIMAHEINNIPYESDELPLDIIEIDAASNRRIDEIRDLREKVRIAPVSAKYKVYIIDEVHMLTREAFNALLKTLEEPPAHVIFILATTEAHKLPETIVSRTQRYTFKLASQAEVAAHLKDIAKKENVAIDDDALELLARHSGGSLRDALSLLDQVRHTKSTITVEAIQQNLGLPSETLVTELISAIQEQSPRKIVETIAQAKADGVSASLVAEQLLAAIRESLIAGSPLLPLNEVVALSQSLLLVDSSSRPEVQLELALIGAQLLHNSQSAHKPVVSEAHMQATQPPLTISEPAKRPAVRKVVNKPEPVKADSSKSLEVSTTPPAVTNAAPATEMSPDCWNQLLANLRLTHNTLYSILRMAQPNYESLDAKRFTLLFKFPFHQKRMNESKNKAVILEGLAALGVSGYEIVCEILPKQKEEPMSEAVLEPFTYEPPKPEDNPLLSQIRNVFGGAEVLE